MELTCRCPSCMWDPGPPRLMTGEDGLCDECREAGCKADELVMVENWVMIENE